MGVPESSIPIEPLRSRATSAGWFPDVALHQRAGKVFHESSYGMLVFTAVMTLIGIGILLIPRDVWATLGAPARVKYFVGCGVLWGGACVAAIYMLRNAVGQRVVMDSDRGRLEMKSMAHQDDIAIDDVAGVQLCRSTKGFQVNLVYQSKSHGLMRCCLYSHVSRRRCIALAEQYQRLCGFEIYDHTDMTDGRIRN